MTTEFTSLNALVVSQDTATLFDLSWMLSAVGYSVEVTKHCEPEAPWRRYAEADFILLDDRSCEGPYEPAMTCESDNPVYWILLYDPKTTTGFSAWYGAGGHDALRVPVSRGELLTRMRAGARFLEFERRLKRQSGEELASGMLSKVGLLRKLDRLAAKCDFDEAQHTLAVTAIDWYDGILRKFGQIACRRLVNAAASAVKRTAGDAAATAYLGKGRFATLRAGEAISVTRHVMERMALEFRRCEELQTAIARPTLTTAIVPWHPGKTPRQLLEFGLMALDLARQSGGDCVVEHGQFALELAAWQSEMATGNPFANVVAQDIMEPFAAVLRSGAEQPALVAALKRAGVPVCPYVDREGRLIGVASPQPRDETNLCDADELAALPIAKPTPIPHNATFPEIYETFAAQACSTLIVVADGRPLGYLTCDGFLSLIEPIDSATFKSSAELTDSSMDLIVASASSTSDSA